MPRREVIFIDNREEHAYDISTNVIRHVCTCSLNALRFVSTHGRRPLVTNSFLVKYQWKLSSIDAMATCLDNLHENMNTIMITQC
jgi:hypothetical protein